MKIVFSLLFYTLLTSPLIVFPQNSKTEINAKKVHIHGSVIDSASKMGLGYASVGVMNQPLGTVADSSGHFDLVIDDQYLSDTIQVSTVGYSSRKILVSQVLKQKDALAVNLVKKAIQLREVAVTNRFQHTEVFGRQSNGTLIQASIIPKGNNDPVVGAESGLKIQANHYPALLKNFNFYISANNFRHIKFRLNIYSLKNNLPDTLIANNEILIDLKDYKTGWFQIDLTPYHIVIEKDCAMILQWVDYNREMVKKPQILIPAGISFSHITYFRTTSQDKWRSVKGNISCFVTLDY